MIPIANDIGDVVDERLLAREDAVSFIYMIRSHLEICHSLLLKHYYSSSITHTVEHFFFFCQSSLIFHSSYRSVVYALPLMRMEWSSVHFHAATISIQDASLNGFGYMQHAHSASTISSREVNHSERDAPFLSL